MYEVILEYLLITLYVGGNAIGQVIIVADNETLMAPYS